MNDLISLNTGATNTAVITREEDSELFELLEGTRAEATRNAYSSQLRKFGRWMETRGASVILPVPGEVISLYVSHLNHEGLKASTITQAIAALEALHNDNGYQMALFRHHLVKSAMTASRRQMVEDGRSSVKKAPALSKGEVEQLLRAVGTANDPLTVRNRALLTLGFASALRASNLLELRLDDITLESTGALVRLRKSKTDQFGKGTSLFVERLAPRSAVFDPVLAMEAWLPVRAELLEVAGLPLDGPLFPAMRKGGVLDIREGQAHTMTTVALANVMRGTAERAGITAAVSPHTMRHTFVSLALSAGADASTVAKTTGHKSLDVLAGYDQRAIRGSALTNRIFG